MKRNNAVLAALAAFALAAIVGLFLVLRTDSPPAPAPAPEIAPGPVAPLPPPRQPRPAPPDLGGVEISQTPPSTPAPAPLKEAVAEDGTVIRDHRSGNPPPTAAPVAPPERPPVPMQPSSIFSIRGEIRSIVGRCAASIPAEVRGGGAGVMARLHVAVGDGHVTIADADLQPQKLDAVTGDALVGCIRDAFSTLSIALPDEKAVDDRYPLTLPFRFDQMPLP
jgi:hypothetical protein